VRATVAREGETEEDGEEKAVLLHSDVGELIEGTEQKEEEDELLTGLALKPKRERGFHMGARQQNLLMLTTDLCV
jgi:hypothetical protein